MRTPLLDRVVPNRARRLTAATLTAVLLAACGGGGSSDDLASQLNASESTVGNDAGNNAGNDAGNSSTTAAVRQPVVVNKTVWWDGFKITVHDVTPSSNALSGTVNISMTLENLTNEPAYLDQRQVSLTSADQSYLSGFAQGPLVPGQAKNDALFDFLVDDTFVIADAVLTFGNPGTNQGVMPLGAGDASSFEPREFNSAGSLVTPDLTITLASGTLVASYAPDEEGTYIIRVPFTASYTGGSGGGYYLDPSQFALESPTGNATAAIPIASGDLIADGVYTGVELKGLSLAFKVTDITAGTWTLTLTDSSGATADHTFGTS